MAVLHTISSALKQLPRAVRYLLILLVIFALYCASIFWLLPMWLKKAIPEYSQTYLGAETQVNEIQINPLTLEIDVNGLAVTYKGDPVIKWESLQTNLDPWKYVNTRSLHVATIDVKGLNLNIQRSIDGQFNIGQILEELASRTAKVSESNPPETTENTENESSIPVVIEAISLTESAIQYSEEIPGIAQAKTLFTYDISGDIRGSNINTAENQQGKISSTLVLKNAGTLSSDLDLQIKPLKISGNLNIDKLVIGDAFNYVASNFRFELANGLLSARIPFNFQDSNLTVNDSQIILQNIKINSLEKDNDTSVDAPNITATGLSLNSEKSQISIKNLDIAPGTVKSRLDINHEASLVKLFQPITPSEPKESETTWQIDLANLSVNKWTVAIVDESQKKPVRVQLSPTNLNIKDFSTSKQELIISIDTQVNSGGSLAARGPIKLTPFSTELDIEVDKFNLPFTQTYWQEQVLIDLLNGNVSTKGKLSLVPNKNNATEATFRGDVVINDVKTQDRLGKRPLLNWQKTALNDLTFTTSPMALSISSIDIDALFAKVIVNKDQTINLQKLVKESPEQPTKKPANSNKKAKNAEPEFDLAIGDIKFTNSRLDFTDQNIQPNFNADIQKLRGNISGIGNTKKQQATINLRGSINNYAPVTIVGRFNPDNFTEFADVAVNFRNIDMTAFSPYSGTFAGYKIEKGKLRVDLHYIIDNRALSAKNYVFADQLTLGERVESESATSLPVKLAINLLKNSKGEIEIDLPLSGDIDHPDFSVTGLIVRAFTNLIQQTVSAPFKMLSNLVGSKEDLNNVSFPAGLATLDSAEISKLEKLAAALNQRPEIYLEIARTVNPDVDVLALREGPDSFTPEILKEQSKQPIVINEDEQESLRELAMQRAQLIRETLEKNGIKSRRLYIIDKIQESPKNDNAMIGVELKINSK